MLKIYFFDMSLKIKQKWDYGPNHPGAQKFMQDSVISRGLAMEIL